MENKTVNQIFDEIMAKMDAEGLIPGNIKITWESHQHGNPVPGMSGMYPKMAFPKIEITGIEPRRFRLDESDI